jgi:hypothetical protein
VSLGMSLSSCSIPGVAGEDRVPDGKAELGLGIHGEPGVELVDYKGARETAAILTEKLFAAVKPAKSYALLLNNLGSTTPLEMSVIANEMLAHPKGKKIKLVVGPALLMTSLDMHGLSASLLPLSEEWEEALTSPVAPAAWPGAHSVQKPSLVKLPKEAKAAARGRRRFERAGCQSGRWRHGLDHGGRRPQPEGRSGKNAACRHGRCLCRDFLHTVDDHGRVIRRLARHPFRRCGRGRQGRRVLAEGA